MGPSNQETLATSEGALGPCRMAGLGKGHRGAPSPALASQPRWSPPRRPATVRRTAGDAVLGRAAGEWRSESMWPLCLAGPRRSASPGSDRSRRSVQGSRPVSRLLSPGRSRGGGHPSGTGVAAGLVRSTRGLGRASLRGRVAATGTSPIRPCSGWGLPSRPVTRPLVRSYRTVSPLPPRLRGAAVCSLWHCPAGRPDWLLASTLPCGGRTFLDPGEPGPRPPSRLPLPVKYATRTRPGGSILGAWFPSWPLPSSWSRWPNWRC